MGVLAVPEVGTTARRRGHVPRSAPFGPARRARSRCIVPTPIGHRARARPLALGRFAGRPSVGRSDPDRRVRRVPVDASQTHAYPTAPCQVGSLAGLSLASLLASEHGRSTAHGRPRPRGLGPSPGDMARDPSSAPARFPFDVVGDAGGGPPGLRTGVRIPIPGSPRGAATDGPMGGAHRCTPLLGRTSDRGDRRTGSRARTAPHRGGDLRTSFTRGLRERPGLPLPPLPRGVVGPDLSGLRGGAHTPLSGTGVSVRSPT